MKTYNWCKKCPNGCCEKRIIDTLNTLWLKVCAECSEQIYLLGNASIDLRRLEELIDEMKEDNENETL